MRKKLLSVFLVLAMVLSLMPATAWAADVTTAEELQKAIETGDAVTLDENITSGESITIRNGTTLNLGGKTLTFTNGALLIIDTTDKEVTITNGTIVGDNTTCGIYLKSGDLTLTSASISGGAGIVVKEGTLNISGGNTVRATSTASVMVGGASVTPAGIVVNRNGYINVNITGGTIRAEGDKVIAYYGTGSTATWVTVNITGGKFNKEVDKDFLPDGGENVPLDGGYTVSDPNNAVARLSGSGKAYLYNNIKDAIDVSQIGGGVGLGDTVTLINDTSSTEKLSVNLKNLTIDLNGKTLNGSITVEAATLTIKDSSGGNGAITTSGDYAIEITGGSLIVEGGNISGTKAAVHFSGGSGTITGGTFTGAKSVEVDESVTLKQFISGGTFLKNVENPDMDIKTSGYIKDGYTQNTKGEVVPVVTITFDPNGGKFDDGENPTEPRKVEGAQGDILEDWPEVSRGEEGDYAFNGWFTEKEGGIRVDPETEDEEYEFTEDTTLFAHWTQEQYTITFDPNYEEADDNECPPMKTGTDGKLIGDLPTLDNRTGYFFDAWYTAREGGEKITTDTVFEEDTTVYAHWIERYNITFDPTHGTFDDDKTDPKTVRTNRKGNVAENNVPTLKDRDDGEFLGWFTEEEGGTEVDPTTEVFTEDTTLYAHWKYTITFNPNGGEFEDGGDEDGNLKLETGDNGSGKLSGLPLAPELEGHKFDDWYIGEAEECKLGKEEDSADQKEDNIDTKVTTGTVFKTNTTVHAHWKQVNFIITFDHNYEGALEEQFETLTTDDHGRLSAEDLSKVTDPTRDEDYEFVGWYTEKTGGTEVTAETEFDDNTTVYAHWKKIGSRTITFDLNYGEEEEEPTPPGPVTTDDDGKPIEWPEDPTREGYDFEGWYTAAEGGKKVTADTEFDDDTTVYAHWHKQPPYTVTFEPNGGGLVPGSASTVLTDEDGKLPEKYLAPERYPSRAGYTFKGWYTAATGGTLVTKDTEFTEDDTKIYAHWGFEITFDLNYETEDDTVTPPDPMLTDEVEDEDGDRVSRLSSLPSPNPTREGYIFDGWYTDDGSTEEKAGEKVTAGAEGTVFTKHTTVYAHWTKKVEYTITFDPNGGTLAESEKTATTVDGKLSSLPNATREDYTFDGWYTEKEGGTKVEAGVYVFEADTTVYAHWKEDTSDTPGGDTPGGDTPGGDTPGGDTPGGDTPGGDTPGGDTPGGDTPGGDTPGGDTPGGDTPDDPKGTYSIQIDSSIRHGKVYTDPSRSSAEEGTTVYLTVKPDSDYTVESVEIRPATGASIWRYPSGETCSFVMPGSNVTIYAKFSLRPEYNNFVPPQTQSQSQNQAQAGAQATLPASAFTPVTWRPAAAMWDVPASSWAYPAAQWAYQNGYLDTAADGTFRLNDTVSHIQLWRIMARWLGESALDDNSVTQWARKSGAIKVGAASGAMTRQNMVEYLYQCYFLMGGDVSVTGSLIQYGDSQLVTSTSAKNAWLWAVNKGIISGTQAGLLNPNGILSRAEFASILMRLCQVR